MGTQKLAGKVISGTPGAITTGVRVQTPSSGEYTGYKIATPQTVVYVLSKTAAAIVIVIYAPEPSVIPTADRLAANVENGAGLNDDPEVSGMVNTLPAALRSGLELTELRTLIPSATGLGPEQLKALLAGNPGGGSDEVIAKARQFLPEKLTAARYAGLDHSLFTVFVGEYGSGLSAWKSWLLLRGVAGLGGTKSVKVHGVGGLSASQNRADAVQV